MGGSFQLTCYPNQLHLLHLARKITGSPTAQENKFLKISTSITTNLRAIFYQSLSLQSNLFYFQPKSSSKDQLWSLGHRDKSYFYHFNGIWVIPVLSSLPHQNHPVTLCGWGFFSKHSESVRSITAITTITTILDGGVLPCISPSSSTVFLEHTFLWLFLLMVFFYYITRVFRKIPEYYKNWSRNFIEIFFMK